MKKILMNFPMPITTNRLIMRPLKIGDGIKLNEAVLETYDKLKVDDAMEPNKTND